MARTVGSSSAAALAAGTGSVDVGAAGPSDLRCVLIAGVALCIAAGPAQAIDTGPDVTGYCVPENTFHDPKDVPPGGSQVATVPGVRASRVTRGGISTPLYESGPAGGDEAVVFVHGNPGSSQDYFDLLPRVGALGRRAVVFDLAGFGHADKPYDLDYSLAATTRRFTQALQQLGIRRVHLVVHDIGGTIGLEWASQRPQELISATILNTGVLIGYEHHDLAQIWRSPGGESFMAGFTRELFRGGVQMGQSRPLPNSFIDRTFDDFDRATRCAVLKGYRSDDVDDPSAVGVRQAAVLRRRPNRPALVVWGDEDPFLEKAIADRQTEAFPEAKINHLTKSGHWPFIDDAERTRGLVMPFIRCLPTGRRDRIRLTVAPRRERGPNTTYRFQTRVVARGLSRPVCGARVKLGRRIVFTDGLGRASVKVRLGPERRLARARKPGLRPAVRFVRSR